MGPAEPDTSMTKLPRRVRKGAAGKRANRRSKKQSPRDGSADKCLDRIAEAMERMLQPDVRARYTELGKQRANALSPAASANVLVDFLSKHLGLDVLHKRPLPHPRGV